MLMIISIVAILFFVIAFNKRKTRFESKSPWQHFFDGIEFSAQYFYIKIESAIKEQNIGVAITKESFLESHIFSAKREYLRVSKGEYVFFICASKFGTGTFVSEWQCIKSESALEKVPFLSKLAGKDRTDKSFYQVDTEAMYRMAIHSALLSAIEEITTSKGVRGLSDLEKIYQPTAK